MTKARLFFALPVDDAVAQEFASLAQALPLNAAAKRVPAKNLHVTLAFIGAYPTADIPDLIDYADSLIHPADIRCHWRVNRLGHFRGGVLYADGWSAPPQMRHLANALSFFVPQQEQHRQFVPHITLARRAERLAQKIEFEFILDFDRVVLFESISCDDGSHYEPLHQWLAN